MSKHPFQWALIFLMSISVITLAQENPNPQPEFQIFVATPEFDIQKPIADGIKVASTSDGWPIVHCFDYHLNGFQKWSENINVTLGGIYSHKKSYDLAGIDLAKVLLYCHSEEIFSGTKGKDNNEFQGFSPDMRGSNWENKLPMSQNPVENTNHNKMDLTEKVVQFKYWVIIGKDSSDVYIKAEDEFLKKYPKFKNSSNSIKFFQDSIISLNKLYQNRGYFEPRELDIEEKVKQYLIKQIMKILPPEPSDSKPSKGNTACVCIRG